MTNWDYDEFTMKIITKCYRARLENVRDSVIERMIKKFQCEMK